MIEIALNKIEKSYGADKILKGVSFDLKTGERAGLIGRNGSGKTTIFKIVSGIEQPDEGLLTFRKDVQIGFLEQNPQYGELSVERVLDLAFADLLETGKELRKLEKQLEYDHSEKLLNKYAQVQSAFDAAGGYEISLKKDRICEGLNIESDMRFRAFSSLSGGEKTTILIAKLLLIQPEVLLLDEPTNHLDIRAVEWLEEYLLSYPGSILIISHDRFFLDRVTNKTIELEYGITQEFSGNYSFYFKEKELQLLQEFEDFKERQKKIKALREAAKRYRVWGNINPDNTAHFARAKRLEKLADELEAIGKPQKSKKMYFAVNQAGRSGNQALEAVSIHKSFGNKKILDDLSFDVQYGESVALLGNNGSGKTTLFKICMEMLSPDIGEIKLGSRVKCGYLPQEITFPAEDKTILDIYRDEFLLGEGEARNDLAKFMFFGLEVFKKAAYLSGGEKVRFRLCQLMRKDLNFLIMDEPTNHLDIDTRESLEDALEKYEGTLFFVSHDRFFINKMCNRIMELDNGELNFFPGNYTEYQEFKKRKILVETSAGNKEKVNARKEDFIRKEDRKKQNQIKKLSELISGTEEKLKTLETDENTYSSDYKQLVRINAEKEELEKELERLYDCWYGLTSD